MKDFKVELGMSREHMIDVLSASLRNDPKPETFSLPRALGHGIKIPSRFVKITALSYVIAL